MKRNEFLKVVLGTTVLTALGLPIKAFASNKKKRSLWEHMFGYMPVPSLIMMFHPFYSRFFRI